MSVFDNVPVYQTQKVREEAGSDKKFRREIVAALIKFGKYDWGDTPEIDSTNNREALKRFEFVLAVYKTSKGRLWITAESDNGKTYSRIVILFPSEY